MRQGASRVYEPVPQFADSFLHCLAHKSAELLCVGKIRGPCIVHERLTHIDRDPIQETQRLGAIVPQSRAERDPVRGRGNWHHADASSAA